MMEEAMDNKWEGLILFKTIKATIGLRVSKRIEEEGLDIYEHGESAYN